MHCAVFSQTYNFQWAHAFDGAGNENCYDVEYDTVNNHVYIVGSHSSNLSSVYAGLSNSTGLNNGFFSKFTYDGLYQWGVSSNGSGTCVFDNLETDENGDIYVSGFFSNTIHINGTGGTSFPMTSAGDNDAFLAKFNESGEILWIKHLTGNNNVVIRDISASQGSVVFVGNHEGTFTITGSGIDVNHSNLIDSYALKFDGNGNFLWRKILVGNSNDIITSVTSQGNSNFISGTFTSAVSNYISSVALGEDGFILKLNTFNGNTQGSKFISGINQDGITSITSDDSGVYVGGYFNDFLINGVTTSTFTLNTSIFVSKLDLNLNSLWDTYGYSSLSNSNTKISKICLDSTGNLFAIGHSPGNLSFTAGSISGTGNLETFIVSLKTANGNLNFVNKVPASIINQGNGIGCNPFTNEVFCVGAFESAIEFSPLNPLIANQTAGYLVKLACTTGSLIFAPNTNFCSLTSNELVIFNNGPSPYVYTVFDGSQSYGINSMNSSDTITFTSLTDITFSIHNFESDGCISPLPVNITLEAGVPISNNFINSNQLTCSNEVPNLLTGTLPMGGSSFNAFKWIESLDNINYIDASGSNNQSNYQPPVLNASRWYKRIVLNEGCGNDTSNFIKIDVFDPIDNNTIFTLENTICLNSSAVITGSNPTGGGNTFNYQWQESLDNLNWNTIPGATFSSYTTPNLNNSIYYRRLAVTPFGCSMDSLYSNALFIQQHDLPNGSFNISEDTLCNTDNLLLEISGAGNQFPINLHYTFEGMNNSFSISSSNAIIDLGNVSTSILEIDSLTGPNGCSSTFTDVFNIVVFDTVGNNVISAPTTICLNDTFTIQGSMPTGGNGIYSFIWEESVDNMNWIPAQGNNMNSSYTLGGISSPLYYRRWSIANVGCTQDSALSNSAQISFTETPELSFNVTDSVCVGEEIILTSINPSGIFPVSIFYNDGTNLNSVELTSNNQQTFFNASNSFTLTIDSLIYTSCSQPIDTNLFIEVFEIPVVHLGNSLNICGNSTEVFPTTTIGTGVFSSTTLTNLPSTPPYLISVNNYDAYPLVFTATNVICSSSDTITIEFTEEPSINVPLTTYNIGIEDSVSVFVTSNSTLDYNWYIENGIATITSSNETSALIENIEGQSLDVVYEIDNGVCPIIFEKIRINRMNLKIPTGFSPNNDAKNDLFLVEGLVTEKYTLTIFDKYNRIVFESGNSAEGFTGNDKNGTPLPEDT